jgi:hypothetical protein
VGGEKCEAYSGSDQSQRPVILPRKAIFLVSAAWNARIYPACCWSDRAPGLDGSPLLLAL